MYLGHFAWVLIKCDFQFSIYKKDIIMCILTCMVGIDELRTYYRCAELLHMQKCKFFLAK